MADKLKIYFTSDMHGYLYPYNFIDEKPHEMGLLSMPFVKDENTLIIDGGDSLQGSPLTYYCSCNGSLAPVADALNSRGYDYVTLGNHDFNYGADMLGDYLNRLNARCLCANVSDTQNRLPITPAVVHMLGNGLRVGLVGIVTDWIKLWEKPENIEGVSITKPLEAAHAAMEGLQADIWIGIYHGGLEKDPDSGETMSTTDENIACRICEELPLKLLLTGHQHIGMANKSWNGVHIVQTPPNAAAYVTVTMDDKGVFHSELCKPSARAELSPSESELWQRLNSWLDRPIGKLSRAILPEDKLKMALCGSPIADFFNRSQLWHSGADISCASLSNEMRGFCCEVTVRDVVATYVYPNTLAVLRVTGAMLRAALEQCARYFDVADDGTVSVASSFLKPKEAHYNYDFFYGIEYTFDLNRPMGDRVARLTRGGKEIHDDDSFTLCMNNYRATGAGDFPFYADCPRVKEIQTEVSELILDYLAANEYIEIESKSCFETIMPYR